AGNRITYQRRFRNETTDADTRELYQRHARGNTLFRNRGDGTFEDISETAQVTLGRWSWGANFVDINNDGWEDLLVGNGMVTSKDDPDDL
ncbi:MAG: VCBS repeat-containing protein, partial [Planctomycetales bacterium]|nr:VCBS repeat-containing protein [Planctomycetales bacterium]